MRHRSLVHEIVDYQLPIFLLNSNASYRNSARIKTVRFRVDLGCIVNKRTNEVAKLLL